MALFASHPNPPMPADNFTSRLTAFEEITGYRADGPDVWISWLGTKPESNTLPGIPNHYLQEVLEGRALYIMGIPLNWHPEALKELFVPLGEATCCPCIIDLRSGSVFRWVIMKTAAQATLAMRIINNLPPGGEGRVSPHLYRAAPPGVTITFSEEFPLSAFRNWELLPPWLHTPPSDEPTESVEPAAPAEPAAPEPARHGTTTIVPALPLQPIAVVVQPPTPPTDHARPAPSHEASAVTVVVQPPTPPTVHAHPAPLDGAHGAAGVVRPAIPAIYARPAPPAGAARGAAGVVQPPTHPVVHARPALPTEARGDTGVVQPPTLPAVHARPAPGTEAPGAARVLQRPTFPALHLRPAPQPARQPSQAELEQYHRINQLVDLDEFVPQAVTWANIVSARSGLEPEREGPRPAPRQASGNGPRLNSIGRIPPVVRQNRAGVESAAAKMRVVFLLNLPEHVTLINVSDAIKEGSLHSIRFGIDEKEKTRYCGIVFQHAHEAEVFYKVITRERADYKPSRFPFIAKAARGDPFPADSTIKAMGPPTHASRRLTIVKSRFFFAYNEDRFRNVCANMVGAEQIQYIWLYNGGNATVIFANVESAMTVKSKLENLVKMAGKDENNTYFGLQVTFSKDPCLQPLQFVTDIHE